MVIGCGDDCWCFAIILLVFVLALALLCALYCVWCCSLSLATVNISKIKFSHDQKILDKFSSRSEVVLGLLHCTLPSNF